MSSTTGYLSAYHQLLRDWKMWALPWNPLRVLPLNPLRGFVLEPPQLMNPAFKLCWCATHPRPVARPQYFRPSLPFATGPDILMGLSTEQSTSLLIILRGWRTSRVSNTGYFKLHIKSHLLSNITTSQQFSIMIKVYIQLPNCGGWGNPIQTYYSL